MTGKTSTRARSEDQKVERQSSILACARDLIEEVGCDSVTMSALAMRAGLAKGTLYLYVRSKEELFLLLFVDALESVVSQFEAKVELSDDPADLARCLTNLTANTPLFLPLFARLVAVIETNVADEPLFAAKRSMLRKIERFTIRLAHLLRLDPKTAELTARTLMNVLQGTAQFDLTSGRDPEGLPDDMREAFARNAFALNFEPAAKLILSAVKAPVT